MAKAKKFGALSGVFTPSILTILGVIMYLRLPWIVGQAGLWATIGIILVAHIISFATALSVASIATDKKVETGGSYYIISRSLGLPIGGTLGIALFIGLSFSVSLYLIGFAEVFLGYFGMEVTLNNIRLTGAVTLLALTVLTFISTSMAIKAQYIILTALALSLISVVFGGGGQTPTEPLFSSMSGSLPWIALFAIFFPAVTGFEAGVSMSGDLKDPRKNIPIGTIAAVLVGLAVYIGLAFFFSYRVERNLLVNDASVLFVISWIPQLVVAGILGATLSSALGSILGAPRILQATSIDRITPAILGKGYGASNEPRNALLFTFIIALGGILIGELNVIARVVTIFFIITYGFLNITYALESWAGTDFRPSFKIPGIISIIGAITSIVVMIQLDIVAMIGASVLLMGLFLFLKRKELTLQTGDTWNSIWASLVKTGLKKLTSSNREPRNWRPNIILFSGGARNRPWLIDLAKSLAGKLGIFTNFELVEDKDEKTLFSKSKQVIEEEAQSRKGVFTRRHVCRDVYEGMESIAKIYGFSGFEPNTILMGWPANRPNPEGFTRLVRSFRKLDYNQVFLHYDKTFAFGKRKNIDIWWTGKGRSISLALSLLRFISSSHEWRTARVRVLSIANQSVLLEKYYELLDQILENYRITAEVKVINNSVEKLPLPEIMRSESLNTDLAIIGMEEINEDFYMQVNQWVESLPSCMVLSASSFFEAHSVINRQPSEKLEIPESTPEPSFDLLPSLKMAQRELIANEVYNLAKQLAPHTQKLYEETFELLRLKYVGFYDQLQQTALRTSDQLYQISKNNDDAYMKAEFLQVLNSFSFRAQSLLTELNTEWITAQENYLQKGIEKYFSDLNHYLTDLPRFIRIKYEWREYSRLKPDSLATAAFRLWKILKARVTGKPAIYKMKVWRMARYYLYHKRLSLLQKIYREFALQSFESIMMTRNILMGIYEMAEKGKYQKTDKEKLKNSFLMEKDRFKAAISLQSDKNNNFFYHIGNRLSEELLADLQSFSDMMDRPGANFISKPFEKACKEDETLLEQVLDFPNVWRNNIRLFVNKVYLDFLILSLKNRIEAKISKYNSEYQTRYIPSFIRPLDELMQHLQHFAQTGKMDNQPDRSAFLLPALEQHYNKLFDEINILFADLPSSISIAGEDLSVSEEDKRIEETTEIDIRLRKTVEFSIASEFIDVSRKLSMEASMALTKVLNGVRDHIRLINFNLFDETEAQDLSQKKELTADFASKLEKEKEQAIKILANFEADMAQVLQNTFIPLSSSVIAKTSGSIKQRVSAGRNRLLYENWLKLQRDISGVLQEQFVKLVYSKSEGILWMGRMENSQSQPDLNNEAVFSWLDQYYPRAHMVEKLPFYYSKLFSGQSGIGEDFWIGMEEELQHVLRGIDRFKQGQPGCLIITGERNSGKTSLSKFAARKAFAGDQVFVMRAPVESVSDVDVFDDLLLRTVQSNHSVFDTYLQDIRKPVAVIINDLELWWERRSGGTSVIQRIIELVKKSRGKVLFIINMNIHALSLVNRITGLQTWSLANIVCNGFDAKELHDLIMLRHKAGGLECVMNKRRQENMTSWGYARLFNRYFDLSQGNPGMALNLWLASIERISGKTLYMRKPKVIKADFLHKLTREQTYYLLQFIYHQRLGLEKLTLFTEGDYDNTVHQITDLWQSGILVEKFPGVYAINPALQHAIVSRMKELKLL